MAAIEIEQEAPGFEDLLGVDGNQYSLSSFDGERVLVVVFVSNGCPTVRALETWLIWFQTAYAPYSVQVVFINSNNPFLSPPDTYEKMAERALRAGFNFPYLRDENGLVARRFSAVTTPHTFVLDEQRRIRYRGRVADSRQASTITNPYLQRAVDDLLAGREVGVSETEPYGCAIVW